MKGPYLTPPAISRQYGVKVENVHAWIESGELAAVNTAKRPNGRPRWKVSAEALEAFEQRRSSRPRPKSTPKTRRKIPQYV